MKQVMMVMNIDIQMAISAYICLQSED